MNWFDAKPRSSRTGRMVGLLFMAGVMYFGGCKSNPADANDGGNKNNTTPRTAVPAEIAGDWYNGSISTINYYNPTTGQWSPPSGTGISYKFTADGYYEKGGLLQTSLYGCTTTLFVYYKGTVAIEGSTIKFYPTYGRIKSQDNCVERFNFDKPAELKQESASWWIAADAYGVPALWIGDPEGEATPYYRR